MKKNYFLIANSFLLLLSIIGFSDNLFFDIHQESNSDPKFIVHGLLFLMWFTILVIQSAYINKGNIRTHMRLGQLGMFIGLAVVLSTFYVFIVIFESWEAMPFFVKANRIFTTLFAIAILLSYIKRKNGVLHKRLIFVGTLFVLGPILDRVGGLFFEVNGINPYIVMLELIIWNSLFISLFIYDWLTLKKIHFISWGGVILFYIVWGLCFFVL